MTKARVKNKLSQLFPKKYKTSDFFFSQTPLIKILRAMSFLGDERGVCAGTTHLWEQSVLCDEEENFLNRMIFIEDQYNGYKRKDPTQKTDVELEFATEIQKKMTGIHTKIKEDKSGTPLESLLPEDLRWLDIEAFGNGIELFQKADKHSDVFNREQSKRGDEKIFKFTSSFELEKRGGAVEIYNEPWIFRKDSKEDIDEYFTKLARILAENPHGKKFAMDLSMPGYDAKPGHRIGIKFAGTNWRGEYLWKIMDPGTGAMIVQQSELSGRLTHILSIAQHGRPDMQLDLKIFTTGNIKKDPSMQILEEKLQAFQKSHVINEEIIKLDKANGHSLLSSFEDYGHLDRLKELWPKLNKKETGSDLLLKFAQTGNIPAMKRILQSGIDVNQRITSLRYAGKTIAHIAAKHGDIDMLRLLDAHGADFTKRDLGNFGKTPLDYANSQNDVMTSHFILSVLKREELLADCDKLIAKLDVFDSQSEKYRPELENIKNKINAEWKNYDDKNNHKDFVKRSGGWKNVVNDFSKSCEESHQIIFHRNQLISKDAPKYTTSHIDSVLKSSMPEEKMSSDKTFFEKCFHKDLNTHTAIERIEPHHIPENKYFIVKHGDNNEYDIIIKTNSTIVTAFIYQDELERIDENDVEAFIANKLIKNGFTQQPISISPLSEDDYNNQYSRYLEKQLDFKNENSVITFKGEMRREDAIKEFKEKEDGCYLLRYSDSTKCYYISVKNQQTIFEVPILPKDYKTIIDAYRANNSEPVKKIINEFISKKSATKFNLHDISQKPSSALCNDQTFSEKVTLKS